MSEPRPSLARRLRVGRFALDFTGLDPALASALDRRWGPFLGLAGEDPADLTVAVAQAGPEVGLGPWAPGEAYRVEADRGPEGPRVRSYGFSLDAAGSGGFTLRLVTGSPEPLERRVDNAARLLVARLALGAGGFALHGAGVLDGARAHVLAGRSRAGKSTAVASLGWPSLGDDFAVVVPGTAGWEAVAVPFDNAESVPPDAAIGAFALGSLWRLEQGAQGARTALTTTAAATAITSCAAFPWAVPDLADRLLASVLRCAREVPCGVLTFARDSDLRALLR